MTENREEVNVIPLSQMGMIQAMLTEELAGTREQLGTLTEALDRPHVLNDEIIARVKKVYTDQQGMLYAYEITLERWKALTLTPAQLQRVQTMEGQLKDLTAVTAQVLELADKLSEGTINKVLGMSDLEVALLYLSQQKKR
ncbi:hypothetical protein [Deinococcus cellulosilyticus]|uniref:Uncharacterized protein n=1 Tax=Deinococcus cellulosilyticus (strain DSM 18568 / NBRC 106333 / KACC 11606 / 5516J-15) TaxID=1223518 RepID=A0A511N9F4_DEIC1|nr:hypothetical protein [Deinococcus cellulosilyticus]GEM49463.1 hypothetical protein DC3_50980 [Deinococcus cellulosilyticus NBRC 106333 = KACC 11606]